MSLLSEFDEIIDKEKQIVGQAATALFGDLEEIMPVKSGFLRNGWEAPKETKDGWVISNPVKYADIRYSEYRKVRGKTYGSLQNPEGIDPTIMRYDKKLQQELNRIK